MLINSFFKQMGKPEEGTEPWFKMPYVGAPLPPSLLDQWAAAAPSADLLLPARNEFLPSDFDLVSPPAAAGEDAPAVAGGAAVGCNGHVQVGQALLGI